jgi:aminopeptidase N
MLYVTREQSDVVAQDVVQSLEFFTKLYGELPIKHLNATEQPGAHGEAFPGLLHLASYAFMRSFDVNKNDDFFGEQFTSHEVAHQWWGIAVDFTSYRDQWISEGFAMYSCLLYSQLAAKDRDKFFYLLNDYRKQILGRGKKTFGETQAQPMISLGYRARIGGGGADHNLYVYYKPAWVLHMLRNMMLNLQTMDEAPFMNAMKEFYTTYKNKHATTDDFRRIMEKHAGIDLTWFFDQWIHGNQIPSYTFAWTKKKRDDGNWVITCRVKQDNVDPEFAMYVPIKVVTKQGGLRLRAMITGAESTFELPALNDEPTEVTFNDLESVLCTVDTEKF